jgi:hypothetical protein
VVYYYLLPMASLVRTILFVTFITTLSLIVFPVFAEFTTVDGGEFGIATGTLEDRLPKVINAFLGIVSIIAVAAIIYGGFKYITSAGNDKDLTAAKNIIVYAVIGLIVIGLAAVLVNFVISAVKGDGDAGGGQGQGVGAGPGGAGGVPNR